MVESKQISFFTATEVCSIIEASARAQVRLLKWGDLHVEFDRPVEKIENSAPTPATEIAEPPNHEEQERLSLEEEELLTREDQIAELLLTDPGQAEQLISEGELEEDEREIDEEA